MSAAPAIAQAFESLRLGRATLAEAQCLEILRHQPNQPDALQVLGMVALQRGNAAGGVDFLRASLRFNPNNPLAHFNLGHALCELGQQYTALESYRCALDLEPGFAGAWYSQGNALMHLKRDAEALASYDRALALQPNFAEAHNNRGTVLSRLGKRQQALESFERAVRERPRFAAAVGNCAKLQFELGRYPESLILYERLLLLGPAEAYAFRDRARCLTQLGRLDEAQQSFDRALAVDPNDPGALYGRGIVRRLKKRHTLALEDFDRALQLAPDSVEVLYRRAEALRDLGRYAEASAAFAEVLRLDSQRDFALGNLLHCRLQVCDWRDYQALVDQALCGVAEGRRVYLPGAFLAVADSAEAQWRCAQIFAARTPRIPPAPLWAGTAYSHDRIRVAYVSGDFREHPVSQLLVGVLEHHDRTRFEITAVSLAPEQSTPLGERVKRAFDRFVDVSAHSDLEIAARMRELEIDVAVDLMGLSGNGRAGIFAHRPAPVQLGYLGFCATTASRDIDYLIADRTVIAPREEQFFSEKIVYLPECYQPADDRRPIAAAAPSRGECGLPEQGVVFCCFNSHYKISPTIFALWMRLLHSLPDSVLWLSAGADETTRNLRRALDDHGVDPDRLVFAPRVPDPARHLSRLRNADLFLDTLPFNAHATASDALWAGVPVLTCRGRSFAGRVAASLLTAIGLPELVTESKEEYLAKALQLAKNPAELAALRTRLAAQRGTRAPFATARYAASLESAFAAMVDLARRGGPPAGFAVA